MASRRTAEPLLVYGFFQALYAAFCVPVFPLVGDAADYASLIAHGVFSERTVHVGFYAFYRPLHLLNRVGPGIGSDHFLNLCTTFFGALNVAAMYFIARALVTESRIASARHVPLAAAMIYGLSGIVWYHAEFAEVQTLMLLLAHGAFLLFLHEKYALSGASLAVGSLVSQAVAPMGAWFLAVAIHRRVPLRHLSVFGACFVGVLALGILPVHEDYLWGPRGTFTVHGYYLPAGVVKAVLALFYTTLESFWMLLPLGALAASMISKHRLLSSVTLATLPPMLYVGERLGHTDYGIVWLPMAGLIAIWLAVGLGIATQSKRIPLPLRSVLLAGVTGVFLGVNLFTYVLPKQRAWVRADRCLEQVRARVGDGHLVADAYVGMAYGHKFWPGLADVWEAPWSMVPEDREAIAAMAERSEVYVVDHVPPSHFMRQVLLSNPLAKRLIRESRRRAYLEEFSAASGELSALAEGRTLVPVLECHRTTLWRMM